MTTTLKTRLLALLLLAALPVMAQVPPPPKASVTVTPMLLISNANTGTTKLIVQKPVAFNSFTLTVSQQMATNGIGLAWNAPKDPTVIGHKIYYGPASGDYTNLVDAGAATNCTVAGLTVGARYYFAATAYNSAGVESVFSNELSTNQWPLTNNYVFLSVSNTPPGNAAVFYATVTTNSLAVYEKNPVAAKGVLFTNYSGQFKLTPPLMKRL